MSSNRIITQYDLAQRVLAMLKKQQEYFAAKRSGVGVITCQNLLMESKRMEKELREDCEEVVRKVNHDLAKIQEWNKGNPR